MKLLTENLQTFPPFYRLILANNYCIDQVKIVAIKDNDIL